MEIIYYYFSLTYHPHSSDDEYNSLGCVHRFGKLLVWKTAPFYCQDLILHFCVIPKHRHSDFRL
jgi:hypothetical protein